MPCDGSRCGDRRGDEVGPAAATLTSLEVPVGGGRAAFAGGELVGVHREAHRASGLAPLESGSDEHLVEPLRFRLVLHTARPGHNERTDTWRDLVTREHSRCGSKVLDARVGARTDEDGVDA